MWLYKALDIIKVGHSTINVYSCGKTRAVQGRNYIISLIGRKLNWDYCIQAENCETYNAIKSMELLFESKTNKCSKLTFFVDGQLINDI